jgi:hypothetical protein
MFDLVRLITSRRIAPRRRSAPRCALVVLALALFPAVTLASGRVVPADTALATARIINLHHSDAPTLTIESNPVTAEGLRANARLATCVGEAAENTMLAYAQSPRFIGSGSLTVGSATRIAPSSAVARADLAAGRRPHALACAASWVGSALRASAPKNESVTTSAARLPVAGIGTDGAFADRVTAVFRVTHGTRSTSERLFVDSIGFVYGQAEVTIEVTSAIALPSPSLEAHLMARVAARARAAIG